jgi:cell division protein FtsZ
MPLNFKAPEKVILKPVITVIGVGGAGGNAVNNMIAARLQGTNFVVANTDAQALEHSTCENKIQLGAHATRGLGAGASPEVGAIAAEESADEIRGHLEGSNMVFVTAGMGGGTGTGSSPIVAKIAKELGILTVGVVTKPFDFEGAHRMKTADRGVAELQQYVDTLIVIPNQNLFRIANERTTFADAFKMADDVLHAGVRGVTDLMIMPGLINLDFADIRSVMSEMGKAMMGTGEASGEDRAIKAAEAAISNPLLAHGSVRGAKGVLINITGGDLTLFEVDTAANRIREEVGDSEANIIFGSTFNPDLEGVMRVSVVATGIDAEHTKAVIKAQTIIENIVTDNKADVETEKTIENNNSNPNLTVDDEVPSFNHYSAAQQIAEEVKIQNSNLNFRPSVNTMDKQSPAPAPAPKVSYLSKMWNSLKSSDKSPQAQPSVQEYSGNNFNQQTNNSESNIQDVPAFSRKQK